MERLKTPFGEIEVWIDGQSIEYQAQKGSGGRGTRSRCPDLVCGRSYDAFYVFFLCLYLIFMGGYSFFPWMAGVI